jgi:hypothetical protein
MTALALALLVAGPLLAQEPAPAPPAEEPARVRWQTNPSLRPVVGYSRYVGPSAARGGVQLGASGGLALWKAPVLERTRALAAWTTGGLSGLDLRLGSFLGVEKELWGLSVGPDLFWNRYSAGGADLLPSSLGIDFPLDLHLGPEKVYALGGLVPAVLFDPSRHAEGALLGHEFGWRAGIGAHLGRIGLAVQYSRRAVVGGALSGWGVSLSF